MIIVFGSISMDINIPVPHLPRKGETVLGPTYLMSPGGKGANQALAAARLGVKVAMVGKVGDDGMALRAQNALRRAAVMTSGVGEAESLPTGCAVITRDESGDNHIVVATGANATVTHDQVPDEILKSGTIILAQMEVPVAETRRLIERAHERGVRTILNLSPVHDVDAELLAMVDTLIVNEFESVQALEALGLTVDNDPAQQARTLARATHGTCIITLGAAGSVAVTRDGKTIRVPALPIDDVVDTAGAGDAFCGTMAACLHEGKKLDEAMRWASVAGSLACREAGTQDSFVYMGDIEEALPDLGPVSVA